MKKYGISVDDDLAEAIENARIQHSDGGETEIRPRSVVCQEWLQYGRVYAEFLDEEADFTIDSEREALSWLRTALRNQLASEQARTR